MNELRIVLYREDDLWIGQCLEHDIRAQASNVKELENRLVATVEAHKEQGGLADIGPAPKVFFDMWEDSTGAYMPKSDLIVNSEMALCA